MNPITQFLIFATVVTLAGIGDFVCYCHAMRRCRRRHGSMDRWFAMSAWRFFPGSGYWLLLTNTP